MWFLCWKVIWKLPLCNRPLFSRLDAPLNINSTLNLLGEGCRVGILTSSQNSKTVQSLILYGHVVYHQVSVGRSRLILHWIHKIPKKNIFQSIFLVTAFYVIFYLCLYYRPVNPELSRNFLVDSSRRQVGHPCCRTRCINSTFLIWNYGRLLRLWGWVNMEHIKKFSPITIRL